MKNANSKPPPVPRRNTGFAANFQQPSMYPYLSDSTGYGGVYRSPYSMMYSNPGYTYGGGYGMRGNYQSDTFVSGIEDVTGNAFQSVGSVIQAFSSVSMMLESTLFAMQNSIHALASVADQFSHLRLHLINSGISFLRTIKYYFRKFLVLFRLKHHSKDDEYLLESAFRGSSAAESKNLAIVLFFAFVVGTPLIMWRLLRSVISDKESNSEWHKGIGEHFLAEVTYDYTAENRDELSLNAGDIIRIAPIRRQPKIRGWILAADGEKQGIVPANYIKILGKNRPTRKMNLLENESEPQSDVAAGALKVNDEQDEHLSDELVKDTENEESIF